jgi:hypothetical protein
MLERTVEAKAVKRIREFTDKFDHRNRTVEMSIVRLKEMRVGWDVIMPVVDLVESSFVNGRPSESSYALFADTAFIIGKVVEDTKDKKGSDAVRRFLEMATKVANIQGGSDAQKSIVSGMWDFTGNLAGKKTVTHNELFELFDMTTSLLNVFVVQEKAEYAVTIMNGLLPELSLVNEKDLRSTIIGMTRAAGAIQYLRDS